VWGRSVESTAPVSRPRRCRLNTDHSLPSPPENLSIIGDDLSVMPDLQPIEDAVPHPITERAGHAIDPLYLFACRLEWEKQEDPTAAWELISAAQSPDAEARAQARSMLAGSRHLAGMGSNGASAFCSRRRKRQETVEDDMKAPYNLEIIENCAECANSNTAFFCRFSESVLSSLDQVCHKSTLPAGAILFVEGQAPRGMFIICSGRVNLSITSREGKILILKTAYAGEALGLSASVSGMGYEVTAETATPCLVNFVDRTHFLELMQSHSELGVHTAQCLSRDFRSAHRDIHDLVLTRSSAGKLARLLLSQSPFDETETESRIHASMTHEEMGQRIGASRETVTRLLSHLRKKHLIRLDGPTLVIRDRSGLEAIAS
jgi:CRP/FNR family cyclic AMP-dependent transcriptional regulator